MWRHPRKLVSKITEEIVTRPHHSTGAPETIVRRTATLECGHQHSLCFRWPTEAPRNPKRMACNLCPGARIV